MALFNIANSAAGMVYRMEKILSGYPGFSKACREAVLAQLPRPEGCAGACT
ncbi:MAG: hypothetical protein N2255_00225 [Kiritimatiellae bacterium]|nr:hypothetical protein [Kiritimatiellia bacterium]